MLTLTLLKTVLQYNKAIERSFNRAKEPIGVNLYNNLSQGQYYHHMEYASKIVEGTDSA